jgi:hypothetical protein
MLKLVPQRLVLLIIAVALWPRPARGQLLSHPNPCLDYVYPAGGRAGERLTVDFGGLNRLDGGREIVIDGPPGITVVEVKPVNTAQVQATFQIAPDAAPGRRLVRVLGNHGLSGFRYFFVGRLPEHIEKEPNNTIESAESVVAPTVINGRLNPAVDVDFFRFQAEAGQHVVAAVLAHGMDSVVRGKGLLDTSLQLLDSDGRTLAAAEDTLGLDPVLDYTVKSAGSYVVRVQGLSYMGGVDAVYRLTVGAVPYPTHAFPPGGQRGRTVEVELGGPNVPAGRHAVAVPTGDFPFDFAVTDGLAANSADVPLVRGDWPETIEAEPNNDQSAAVVLQVPGTVNARFDQAGDADWFRTPLKKGQGVVIEIAAQRYLRSAADTLVEVFDAAGKKLAENDDGAMFAGQCEHDFAAADSRLEFTAPQDGDYLVRVTDQTGAGGPHAVYRLTATPLEPDFRLFQWPDVLPIWGPGSSSAFVVQVQRWGGLAADIKLSIEGLPTGWTGSVGNLPASSYLVSSGPLGQKALLTITAAPDIAPLTHVPFRVVGRAEQAGRTIEHAAQPLCRYLYQSGSFNDRLPFRPSPVARAVVAGPLDARLETSVRELTVKLGGTVEIPVRVHRPPDSKAEIGITVDGETVSAGCGWRAPMTIKPDQTEVILPLTVTERRPGTYGIVVSRSWASDLRAGRPGPCTSLILLHVQP